MSHVYLSTGAEMSGPYRYRLWRAWSDPVVPRTVLWIMLNPSTADDELDDPTIRKCVGFSKKWGYDRLQVVNLFAFRATDPKHIPKGPSAIGPGNDDTIRAAVKDASLVVCAWGGSKAADRRGPGMLTLLAGSTLESLGETAKGHPKHPLFLPYTTERQVWAP